ncbi:MAG TPA: hypothetical protein VGK73_24825 [Polyangiaceae bacterium]
MFETRERQRQLLDQTIELAQSTLAASRVGEGDASEKAAVTAARAARVTLARAHAEKARDALHGVNQLSMSAQRAPTREACDDGWRRVESICSVAESSAVAAELVARELEDDLVRPSVRRAARQAAQSAEAAAAAARKIIEERNHAYTFHADSRFSFGEGWYLAAAGVLAGVTIQIEPGKDGTQQAERFLTDAGLSARTTPYRPRPRAMKQVTELVGRAFRADPASAQRRVRAAFLGGDPVPDAVSDWVERRLRMASDRARNGRKVLLWVRYGVHHPGRNTPFAELGELSARVQRAGLVPILTGDALRGEEVPDGALDMILFWKDPVFRGPDMRRAQLQFFECLKERHGLVGQLGVTTAGMDGPALIGLPTLYLTEAPNLRMRQWVGAVPGYEEIVRAPGYLERVSSVLSEWADSDYKLPKPSARPAER